MLKAEAEAGRYVRRGVLDEAGVGPVGSDEVNPMRRRKFLVEGGRAVLRFSLLPLMARAQGNQKPPESKGDASSAVLIAELEKQIPPRMEEAKVPGLSIAIIKDGKLFWRGAFGVKDSASKEPVDSDTLFEAASVSKTVFAYAVMKLCEKGAMNLDTPLTKYTSERFLEGDPRLDLITARHVLSHTTGFQNWRSKEKPLQIRFTPGDRFSYSGEGYYYLQSVVTHLRGHVNREVSSRYEAGLEVFATDFDEYMRANLFKPFGMDASVYVWNDTLRNYAAPHDAEGKPSAKRKTRATTAARYGAAGGLHTTPTDYAKFLIEVINPKATDAFRLSKDGLTEMLRPHAKINGSISQALGWQIRHTENGDFIMHGGGNPGFAAFVVASVPRKSGLVIMTNSDNGHLVIEKLLLGDILHQFLGARMPYPRF
jgi:CubicO group peptidase (beta-lactamase class C family)